MKTCREVLDSLSSFIDEEMKQEVALEMHKHIHVCSECRAHFDSLTMTIKLYRHVENPSMPAGCHDRLVKVLELERIKPEAVSGASTPGSAEPAKPGKARKSGKSADKS
jgi:predicted anti-sigma-YlaC factor YlaD